jgi:hypothetical protein
MTTGNTKLVNTISRAKERDLHIEIALDPVIPAPAKPAKKLGVAELVIKVAAPAPTPTEGCVVDTNIWAKLVTIPLAKPKASFGAAVPTKELAASPARRLEYMTAGIIVTGRGTDCPTPTVPTSMVLTVIVGTHNARPSAIPPQNVGRDDPVKDTPARFATRAAWIALETTGIS